jgi:hypothetical protein
MRGGTMAYKSPEEKLEEFLAAQPSWLRKILQDDLSLTPDEQLAWNQSDSWWKDGGAKVQEKYETILQRIPAKWREHWRRKRQNALEGLPSSRLGRPRKDALAEEAKQLRQAGKSPAEIAILLRAKHTIMSKKGIRQPTPDGIRKLLESRKDRSTPDKP